MLGETWGGLSIGWGFWGGYGDTPVRARILPVNCSVCEVDFNVISEKDVVKYILRREGGARSPAGLFWDIEKG